jgi:lysozyme family protein
MTNFDRAFETIIGHEGGYVNDPHDPGGETKYGISKRAYPKEDIRALTLERAKFLYRRDYWNKVKGNDWPYIVSENLFDGAVHSGVEQAVKWLQMAVRVTVDGDIGPVTKAAVLAANPIVTAARFNGYRLDFLNDLSRWPRYGKGWVQRIAKQLMSFVADAATPTEPVEDGAYGVWLGELKAVIERAPKARR